MCANPCRFILVNIYPIWLYMIGKCCVLADCHVTLTTIDHNPNRQTRRHFKEILLPKCIYKIITIFQLNQLNVFVCFLIYLMIQLYNTFEVKLGSNSKILFPKCVLRHYALGWTEKVG